MKVRVGGGGSLRKCSETIDFFVSFLTSVSSFQDGKKIVLKKFSFFSFSLSLTHTQKTLREISQWFVRPLKFAKLSID
jgi:hypothetical protein